MAALAFAVFSAGMTIGRVFGDWINARLGPVAMLRWGALLTGIPLAALLLIGSPAAALIGMFAIGLGVANGVPLMFSAAGRQPDTPSGPGIAAVSSLGSLGFLIGPPFIGLLADAVSLPWALATLILGAVAVFALARRAAGPTAPGSTAAPPAAGRERVPVPDFAAVISDLDGVLSTPRRRPCAAGARGASATASTARRSRPATTGARRAR